MHIHARSTANHCCTTLTQEYAREQETAAAAAAAKAARERRRLTALEVDAALKDLLARQAVVCAKHDVLQQIADATTAAGATTSSSSSRRPSGRRSMDGSSSSINSSNSGVVMSAPSTLSATADYNFPATAAAADAAAAAAAASTATSSDSSATSSGSSSRRTQSMDLAKMLSGGWNPVTGTDKQTGESLLTVVADVADEETAETETAETVVSADREPAHSTDTESEYVVVPLPAAATATADADTAAGTTAGVSPPAVPSVDGSSSAAGTTATRKRSDMSLAADTINSSSSSLRVNSSMFSSSSGAPATPSRSAGPCVSSLVQARTAAEAEAASKRAAAVSERIGSAQYKESGARGQCCRLHNIFHANLLMLSRRRLLILYEHKQLHKCFLLPYLVHLPHSCRLVYS
jgi:trimeric autotransporter adhesin